MGKSRRLSSFAEEITAAPPTNTIGMFETIPGLMAKDGRIEGFEGLRDMLLANWQNLAGTFGIPLGALLKLVLEMDRHAIFAMMAEQKLGEADRNKNKRANWLQTYLEGEVDNSTPPEMKLAELPSGDEDNGGE